MGVPSDSTAQTSVQGIAGRHSGYWGVKFCALSRRSFVLPRKEQTVSTVTASSTIMSYILVWSATTMPALQRDAASIDHLCYPENCEYCDSIGYGNAIHTSTMPALDFALLFFSEQSTAFTSPTSCSAATAALLFVFSLLPLQLYLRCSS